MGRMVEAKQGVTMPASWKTKYGPRRVRQELPTLEEAVFAAEGLTDDPQAQAVIAAELMQLPVEQVAAEIGKLRKSPMRVRRTTAVDAGGRGVIVERKAPRRVLANKRLG